MDEIRSMSMFSLVHSHTIEKAERVSGVEIICWFHRIREKIIMYPSNRPIKTKSSRFITLLSSSSSIPSSLSSERAGPIRTKKRSYSSRNSERFAEVTERRGVSTYAEAR